MKGSLFRGAFAAHQMVNRWWPPQGEISPKAIFARGAPEPRSRRGNEAEGISAQSNPPRYLGGYEQEVHGKGTPPKF